MSEGELSPAMCRAVERFEKLLRVMPEAASFVVAASGALVALKKGVEHLSVLAQPPSDDPAEPHSVRPAVVDEDVRLLRPGEWPAEVALRTGRMVHDVVLGLLVPGSRGSHGYRWCAVTAEPFAGESGRPEAAVVSMFDVTEERHALQQLRERERRFRLLADNTSDMISLHAPNGAFLYASPAFGRVLGYEPEWLIGQDPGELMHPDDLPRMQAPHVGLLDDVEVIAFDYRARHADGRYIRLETTAHSIKDDSGEVIEIHAVTRDISAREAAELRFRVAFEEAPIGIVVTELGGRFAEANRAMSDITGYSRAELLGQSFRDITHPDDVSGDLEHQRRLLDGRIPRYELDKRYLRPDGSPVWIRLSVALARGADGEPLYFIRHIQDVEQRRAAEVRLAKLALTDPLTGLANRRLMLDRLDQANRRRRRAGGELGVVFVDLDGFKDCNDRYGHDGGDAMLREVAGRLRSAVRDEDAVSRFGGDEFVIACALLGQEQFGPLVERLRLVCGRPFRIGEDEVPIAASVDGVLAAIEEPLDSVLRRADAAMYAEKARRRAERAPPG